jgi:hypothetical protein
MLMFGENFPSVQAPPAEQVFSIAIATVGLAAFALILALLEQSVQEVLEEQVKRGGKIYEEGHVRCSLLLGLSHAWGLWAGSPGCGMLAEAPLGFCAHCFRALQPHIAHPPISSTALGLDKTRESQSGSRRAPYNLEPLAQDR